LWLPHDWSTDQFRVAEVLPRYFARIRKLDIKLNGLCGARIAPWTRCWPPSVADEGRRATGALA
jgi:hypothetical protein